VPEEPSLQFGQNQPPKSLNQMVPYRVRVGTTVHGMKYDAYSRITEIQDQENKINL
jgi:hypothetical protein